MSQPEPTAQPFSRPSTQMTPSPTSEPTTAQPFSRPSTQTTPLPTFERVSQDQCCPEDNGFCPTDGHTFIIPLLDLSPGSANRPAIDGKIDKDGDNIGDDPIVDGWTGESIENGWVGVEYNNFVALPMFNGGKNGAGGSSIDYTGQIGTSYIAYDCSTETVCVAAHLNADFLEMNPQTQLRMQDQESWIRFGPDGGTKLKESNSDEFSYVRAPDSSAVIGYEGCWTVANIDAQMQSITNNFVEVHFSLWEGQTTSTGKPASDGDFICLKPQCEAVPERIPSRRGLRGLNMN